MLLDIQWCQEVSQVKKRYHKINYIPNLEKRLRACALFPSEVSN